MPHGGWTALIRRPAREGSERDLTFNEGGQIDFERASQQHEAYERAIRNLLKVRVECLPTTPADPDGVFVHDTAVVLSNLFLRSRMAAMSRRAETHTVVAAIQSLSRHRQELYLTGEDATLDGSDVLYDGRRIYVGLGRYTNASAAAELQRLLDSYKYFIKQVGLPPACPHLKAACAGLGQSRFLIDPDWFDPALVTGSQVVAVPREERPGVKALYICEQRVLVSASAPRTADALASAGWGLEVHTVDISEFEKVGGMVSRLSLLVPFEVMGRQTSARASHRAGRT